MSIQDCVKRFMNDENTNRIFNHERKIRDEYLEVGREQGRELGEKIGRKQGEKIGIKKNQLKIAKKMLLANKPINEIITFTELKEKDILSLKQELKLA